VGVAGLLELAQCVEQVPLAASAVTVAPARAQGVGYHVIGAAEFLGLLR